MTETERIARLEHEMEYIKQRVECYSKKAEESSALYKDIQQLAANVEVLSQRIDFLIKGVDKQLKGLEQRQALQGERINLLERKPALRWEALTGQVIAIVVAGLLAIIISKLS